LQSGRRFAEVRKRLGLDVLAAPPAGGRLADKDSIFDCKVRSRYSVAAPD